MATTAEQTTTIKELALGDLETELAHTRKALERIPDAHLDWKPHERSFSLGELAEHITNILFWGITILTRDEFDLGAAPPPDEDATITKAGILDSFDSHADELRQALAAIQDTELMEPWTLRHGEAEIFSMPRLAVMRSMAITHMAHHRGQLTVYFRMLEIPVPAIYGPSADEES